MLPPQNQLILPLTSAIAQAGGSIRPKHAANAIAEQFNLSTEEREQCTVLSGKKVNLVDRTVRWVQQQAKLRGLTAADGDGFWRLTESAEDKLDNARPGVVVTLWENDLGGIVLWGMCETVEQKLDDGVVSTIITSPPYELTRPKQYDARRSESEHVKWLVERAESWKRILAPDGSVFLNLGDVWLPGSPTQSLYQERVLLLQLIDKLGYRLIQKLVWENPAKMPAPAEWVTIRRIRLTPSTENIWWLAPSEYPKANNRSVPVPYSDAMRKTLAKGTNAGRRPSGHDVSVNTFSADNDGAIHHNLIVASNTASRGKYLDSCRNAGIQPHPARFPRAIPEFAIKLTTEEGDVVYDPFGGSLETADVAMQLNRKFITCDRSRHYLDAGILRFTA